MEITTYSFADLVGSISHPKLGIYMFDGTGVGSVTISKTSDRTAHDVASDGSVMVSKVAGNNGTITIDSDYNNLKSTDNVTLNII